VWAALECIAFWMGVCALEGAALNSYP
jgi:hypothetical protein